MTPRPPQDPSAEPSGFLVEVTPGDRVHFLDWRGVGDPGVVLIHGLSHTAWSWAPVARRLLTERQVVAMDLRGHGLSDAPASGYEPADFAADVVAVAEGSGILGTPGARVVLAGHGFGATAAVWAATELGDRCAGLVLVDGGWESIETESRMDVDEYLRTTGEPPEVMRSMAAFLADRAGFDAASWDADQERAARATVVETHAGKVVPATQPHAREGSVRAMFGYDPWAALPMIRAPIAALIAVATGEPARARTLDGVSVARVRAGHDPITITSLPHGHNLMRYRPEVVTAAILSVAGSAATPPR